MQTIAVTRRRQSAFFTALQALPVAHHGTPPLRGETATAVLPSVDQFQGRKNPNALVLGSRHFSMKFIIHTVTQRELSFSERRYIRLSF